MSEQEEMFGVINPNELYTLKAFTKRLGIRASTLRSARRAGLRVYYVHKHAYILGRDWIDYVRSSANELRNKPPGLSEPDNRRPTT